MLKMTGEDQKYSTRDAIFYYYTRCYELFFNNTLVVNIRDLSRRYDDMTWQFRGQPFYWYGDSAWKDVDWKIP